MFKRLLVIIVIFRNTPKSDSIGLQTFSGFVCLSPYKRNIQEIKRKAKKKFYVKGAKLGPLIFY